MFLDCHTMGIEGNIWDFFESICLGPISGTKSASSITKSDKSFTEDEQPSTSESSDDKIIHTQPVYPVRKTKTLNPK